MSNRWPALTKLSDTEHKALDQQQSTPAATIYKRRFRCAQDASAVDLRPSLWDRRSAASSTDHGWRVVHPLVHPPRTTA